MALNPSSFSTKDTLQPGARGETFVQSMPGYRSQEDRVNRTNTRLSMVAHDVPDIKYEFDDRLPVLFRYGFAYGFNQIVTPKGRIVGVDPNMSVVDFETRVPHNVLTLANGGVPVRLRTADDKYGAHTNTKSLISETGAAKAVAHVAKEWAPVAGLDKTYTDTCFRSFATGTDGAFTTASEQLTAASFVVDEKTGRITKNGVIDNTVRAGNVPVGMISRNEYTRDLDAYNGIMPGPIHTDALVELPWFQYKDKAEKNFWGSAYGALVPGALVKSDENGRVTLSPLSVDSVLKTMTAPEIEAERRQVIGEVYATSMDLLPEGSAKWATWALNDRENYEGFNPDEYRQTNRRNEDSISNSPHNSTGEYPGYPFEKAFNNNNLNMLGANARSGVYDPRMDAEYQYSELGIPGLTDGYNAVVHECPTDVAGSIHYAGGADYIEEYFRLVEVNVEDLQVSTNGTVFVACTEGALLADEAFKVTYVSKEQGIVKIAINNKTKADALLSTTSDGKKVDNPCTISFKYKKHGKAGVPTWLDWEGITGSVKILLTK